MSFTTIEQALKNFDFPVGRVITDQTEYDYFIDQHEPTRVYAFEVDSFEDLTDAVEERNPTSGTLIAHIEQTDEILACGIGQYRAITTSAFQPLEEYF